MVRQATVSDLKNQRITRRHGHIVVVTRFYPRYLKKNLIHDYIAALAPARELLKEFREGEAELLAADAESHEAHDRAFAEMDYESRFTLSADGLSELERLAHLSAEQSVYLICHCPVGVCCHRELLMLAARECYGAKIAKLHHDWAKFKARLLQGPAGLLAAES